MKSIFLLVAVLIQVISFYSFSIPDANNGSIDFSDFAGKKVLIVNTSLHTPDTAQYARLEFLWQTHHDSLEIIAIPSNDFGNAPDSISVIRNYVQAHYNIHYHLADKMSVKGTSISPLYSWLADISKNGMMNSSVKSDYYKYLVDRDGTLIGIFDNSEDAFGSNILNAVQQ